MKKLQVIASLVDKHAGCKFIVTGTAAIGAGIS
jgi:hypothetical protein